MAICPMNKPLRVVKSPGSREGYETAYI
jgi:hypothetical protein